MDSSVYRHLVGQFKKNCSIPHHNFPSHNLLSLDNLLEISKDFNNDSTICETMNFSNFPCYYRPFPYAVRQSSVFFYGSGVKDDALELVKKKLNWEKKLNRNLRVSNINIAIKNIKKLRQNKPVRLTKDLKHYIEHFHNDPEPMFTGNYNWLYTGGCLSCSEDFNGTTIISADFFAKKPGFSVLKLNETLDKIQFSSFNQLKAHSPVLQIASRSQQGSLIFCVRQKNYLSLFNKNNADCLFQPLKLWRKKILGPKIFTCVDIKADCDEVIVTDSNHDINIFNVERRNKIHGLSGKKFKLDSDKDFWSQIAYGDCGIYWACRNRFLILDMRVSIINYLKRSPDSAQASRSGDEGSYNNLYNCDDPLLLMSELSKQSCGNRTKLSPSESLLPQLIPQLFFLEDTQRSSEMNISYLNLCLKKKDLHSGAKLQFMPSPSTNNCEDISSFVKSSLDSNYVYLSTTHNVLQIDLREGKPVQRWTHLMKNPPQFMISIKDKKDSEFLVLQSQVVDEISGIVNERIKHGLNINFISRSLPCLLKCIKDSLKMARFHGICLSPFIAKRVNFCVTGMHGLKNNQDKIYLFTQNSGGDIFLSKIQMKTSNNFLTEDKQEVMNTMKLYESHLGKFPFKESVASHLKLTDMSHVLRDIKCSKAKTKLPKTSKPEVYWKHDEKFSPENLKYYKDVLAQKILRVWGHCYEDSVIDDSSVSVNDKVREWMEKY